MDSIEFLDRIATERNCTPELVRAVVTDCLRELHECAFKQGMGMSLIAAYWQLGPAAAWHYGGIVDEASEHSRGELVETYMRLDPTMERFATILDQWRYDMGQSSAWKGDRAW